MNEEEKLQLENECLLKYSKAQMIQKYIDELEENKRLNKCYCERTDCGGRIKESRNYNSLFQENERLNNIINELEKFLDERSEFTNFGFVLDYLKELKENK